MNRPLLLAGATIKSLFTTKSSPLGAGNENPLSTPSVDARSLELCAWISSFAAANPALLRREPETGQCVVSFSPRRTNRSVFCLRPPFHSFALPWVYFLSMKFFKKKFQIDSKLSEHTGSQYKVMIAFVLSFKIYEIDFKNCETVLNKRRRLYMASKEP